MMNESTLDPPGSIAVIGATVHGIEAALYGRFLGYDVALFAGVDAWSDRGDVDESIRRIGPTFRGDWLDRHWLTGRSVVERFDDAAPMMPDRCLSSLAFGAIEAQRGDMIPAALPVTIREWITDGLLAVTRSDLLRGRVFADTLVTGVQQVDVMPGTEDESGEHDEEPMDEIPPDFLLSLRSFDGNETLPNQSFECVIMADVPDDSIAWSMPRPCEYLFELAGDDAPTAESWLRNGYRQIAAIYAELMGRENLDLYRPTRV